MRIIWTQDSAPAAPLGSARPSWTCVLCSAHCAKTPPLWPGSPLQLPPVVCCGQSVPSCRFSSLVKGPGPSPHRTICSWSSLRSQTCLVSRELYKITSQQQQRLRMPSEITAGVDSVPRRDAHVHSCLMDTGRRFSLLSSPYLFSGRVMQRQLSGFNFQSQRVFF